MNRAFTRSKSNTFQRLYLAGVIMTVLVAMLALLASIRPRYDELSTLVPPEGIQVFRGQPTQAMSDALNAIGWSVTIWATYFTILETLMGLVAISVAIFILWKKHDYWFAVFMAIGLATANTGAVHNLYALRDTYTEWYFPIQILTIIGYIAFVGSFILFPNGRYEPRWTRNYFVVWVAYIVITMLFFPEWAPPRVITGMDTFREVFIALFTAFWLSLGIVSQVYRYFWRSTQLEKQQTKWVVFSLFLLFIAFFPLLIGGIISSEFTLSASGSPAVMRFQIIYLTVIYCVSTFLPIVIALAILQYRLWDIDIIINRTLVYGILSILIFGVYLIFVGGLNVLIATSSTPLFSLLATGIVIVSFHSLHERVQHTVNRLMFGQRDEPQKVLINLSQQLQSALMPEDLLHVSTQSICSSLRVPYASIAIQHGKNVITQVEYGKNVMPTESFALVHQNERVGKLVVGQRSPNEKLNASDQAVLSSIAHQMGTIVYAVRLQSDLQIARERLVITREEERRRIRRDLHDGLGPALASQPLQFDIAIEHISKNPELAIELLRDMKQNAKGFVRDIRRVIQDLRPSTLDELGLVESLKIALAQAGSHYTGLQIHFHIPTDLQDLSAAVEVAAYRIIMEAVTNVRKHAQAKDCHVKFHYAENRSLHISIEDNGIGLPEKVTSGVGLQSMRERCEELGGRFNIESIQPHGTRINATLPLISKREHMI